MEKEIRDRINQVCRWTKTQATSERKGNLLRLTNPGWAKRGGGRTAPKAAGLIATTAAVLFGSTDGVAGVVGRGADLGGGPSYT